MVLRLAQAPICRERLAKRPSHCLIKLAARCSSVRAKSLRDVLGRRLFIGPVICSVPEDRIVMSATRT